MLDFPALIAKHGLRISGVLHVGARIGEEADDYAAAGISKVWWVEGNADVIPLLRAKVEPFGHHVIEALVYEEDGVDLTFHITNELGLSSSILRFGIHEQFSPDMVFEKHVEMKSRSIDSLVAEHGVTGANLLVMDLQGAELSALKGAQRFIDQADYVLSEINDAEVYVGCAKIWELDDRLGDFERVETYWVGDQHWGDGLWVRRRPAEQLASSRIVVGAPRINAAHELAMDLAMGSVNVIIPSYNCSAWIDRCLKSVDTQDFSPNRVIVIDDASPDSGYAANVAELCQQYGFTFLRNDTNRKCPYNIWLAMHLLEDAGPDEVVFLLDGDDFLPDPTVLRTVMETYADSDVWLTYGNYRPEPFDTGQTLATAYPPEVIAARSFRKAGAHFNHPLTFRKHLWDHLTPADFQDDNGKWFRGGYDRLLMIPMLEMAAPDHFRFLDKHLYSYNAVNPISDSAVNVDLVEESRGVWDRPPKAQVTR